MNKAYKHWTSILARFEVEVSILLADSIGPWMAAMSTAWVIHLDSSRGRCLLVARIYSLRPSKARDLAFLVSQSSSMNASNSSDVSRSRIDHSNYFRSALYDDAAAGFNECFLLTPSNLSRDATVERCKAAEIAQHDHDHLRFGEMGKEKQGLEPRRRGCPGLLYLRSALLILSIKS